MGLEATLLRLNALLLVNIYHINADLLNMSIICMPPPAIGTLKLELRQWLWLSGRLRYQRFESGHRQNFYKEHLFTINCIKKTKIKEKEAEIGPF